MSELITLDYAKAINRIAGTNTDFDAFITALIPGISAGVETYCRRTFGDTDYDERYDGNSRGSLVLKNFPITELSSVTINPEATIPTVYDADAFIIEAAIGKITFKPSSGGSFDGLNAFFPFGKLNIEVAYSAGYDDVPAAVQLATALAVGNYLNQPDLTKFRETLEGYTYIIRHATGPNGDVSIVFSPEVKELLNPFRNQVG